MSISFKSLESVTLLKKCEVVSQFLYICSAGFMCLTKILFKAFLSQQYELIDKQIYTQDVFNI